MHVPEPEQLTLTRDEALKMVRNAPTGARFAVLAHVDLPSAGEASKVFPSCASLAVSRKDALHFIDSTLSETLEKRGARISVRVSQSMSAALTGRVYYHIG